MAFDSYDSLSAAIASWEERSFTPEKIDEFIALAEAKANRRLQQDFRRRSSGTVTIDADGIGTLPSGFVGMSSLVGPSPGSLPLAQVSWGALTERNPYHVAGYAGAYAISGTTLKVAPITEGAFAVTFSSVLLGLSASNSTNWLLAIAPDFYLFACQAAASAYVKDYQGAALMSAQSDEILNELVTQGNVAEYGNAEMTLSMVTP